MQPEEALATPNAATHHFGFRSTSSHRATGGPEVTIRPAKNRDSAKTGRTLGFPKITGYDMAKPDTTTGLASSGPRRTSFRPRQTDLSADHR